MKKKWFSGLLALVLVLTVLPTVARAAETQKVVHASTVEELRAALQSNTKIILEGKDYNVGYEELALVSLNNVTIQGTEGTRIIGEEYYSTDPRYNGEGAWGMIFFISYSTNILLQDLSIGFDSAPIKTGTENIAVRAIGNFDLKIVNCDLFGADTGLHLTPDADEDVVRGAKFHMESSTIRDSIRGIADVSMMETESVTFTNCTFSGNGLGTKDIGGPVPGYGETRDYLSPYSFYGSCTDYGYPVDKPAVFTNCVFSNNKNPHRDRYFFYESDDKEGTFAVYNNCTFEGNAWAEVPSSAPASAPAKTPAKTPATDKTTASAPASGFSDVPNDYWASKEIAWASAQGIMNGVGGGRFNPGAEMTYQQAWMAVARMGGANPANMAEAKKWVEERKLTAGEIPTRPLTRQGLVNILQKFAMGKRYSMRSGPLEGYPDIPEEGYKKGPLSWAVYQGILTGTSDGRLNSEGTVTRAQFVVFLYRFDLYVQKNAD